MADNSDDPTGADAGSPPKFMRTIQGWLIGLGGIVAAILALKSTALPLFSGHDPKPAEQAQSADKSAVDDPTPTPATVAQAPQAPPSTPSPATAKALPTVYRIPGGSLSFDGSKWIEENDQSVKTFREVSRNSDGKTLLRDGDTYLRFPNDGGPVEYSDAYPANWREIYVAEPSEAK
ncbi:hypothetical protein ABDK56_11300 [Sphingomonas sp. ASV193]|uniref:hypothetical protein n=1 Tax=Sphingomonas sp. ASV193 TaxID=3144405 RepID=UPI0032E8B49B